jgi:fimbrial isopeptide formation D2 family protein
MVFDRDTGAFSSVGHIDPAQLPHTNLKEGAFYADADGFLYASDNDDGNIYRVNVQDATAALFASGPSSASNDGARCAQATIPIDFSDAPSLYDTLLADNGPRHSVADFNDVNNTAPLMLGKKVDIETDGFPGAEANGDDLNNIDDEDGVTHIVVTPGTPTALSIPITVTNNNPIAATLAGWVDLDSSGTFDTGERVTQTIPANSGTAKYELDFPSATFAADSFARFRVFDGTIADPQPTGSATGGEVEDYLVQVGTYTVNKTSTPPSGTTVTSGDTVSYAITVNNTGLTDLINLTLHDDLSNVLDDAALVGSPVVSPASAGTATVDQGALEFAFTGDVLTGQTVTITYEVQVSNLGALGNSTLSNMVIATHSNCHPELNGQTVTVTDTTCRTEHPIDRTLANTGVNIVTIATIAIGLLAASGVMLYIVRRYFPHLQSSVHGTP